MLKPQKLSKFLSLLFVLSIIISLIDFIFSFSYPMLISSGNTGFGNLIWNYLDFKCHQLPERSFFIMEHQMPICSRCTFVLIGKICFCLMILNKNLREKLENNFISILPALLPPLIIEAIMKIFFNYPSGVFIRSINGLLQGFIIYLILYKAIKVLNKLPEWKNIFLLKTRIN